ncbi:MAG: type II toxin-antitoxin system prevent-host-death family antitoxin [Anaerolineae bacterium]|jgi:prevent-host-death family protein|nr:type II toxin-antitoxin system prevent-host-death family antitoxin [Anaerolineae bacterium]
METTTTIRELKAQLSTYLRRVESGETVTITRHGKPVGRIVPVEATLEARMEALEQAGLLVWNGEHLPPLAPVAHTAGAATVAQLLVEDRASEERGV